MDAHVFIDNSNVFGGAQRAAEAIEPGIVRKSVRVYYKNLFKLIENGFRPVTRVLAGSLPPGNDSLWDHARNKGYDTDLLHRVDRDDGRVAEQGWMKLSISRLPTLFSTLTRLKPWFSLLATAMTRTSERASFSKFAAH